jgi:hypothetical protein
MLVGYEKNGDHMHLEITVNPDMNEYRPGDEDQPFEICLNSAAAVEGFFDLVDEIRAAIDGTECITFLSDHSVKC